MGYRHRQSIANDGKQFHGKNQYHQFGKPTLVKSPATIDHVESILGGESSGNNALYAIMANRPVKRHGQYGQDEQ
jgi:hypothetical protein